MAKKTKKNIGDDGVDHSKRGFLVRAPLTVATSVMAPPTPSAEPAALDKASAVLDNSELRWGVSEVLDELQAMILHKTPEPITEQHDHAILKKQLEKVIRMIHWTNGTDDILSKTFAGSDIDYESFISEAFEEMERTGTHTDMHAEESTLRSILKEGEHRNLSEVFAELEAKNIAINQTAKAQLSGISEDQAYRAAYFDGKELNGELMQLRLIDLKDIIPEPLNRARKLAEDYELASRNDYSLYRLMDDAHISEEQINQFHNELREEIYKSLRKGESTALISKRLNYFFDSQKMLPSPEQIALDERYFETPEDALEPLQIEVLEERKDNTPLAPLNTNQRDLYLHKSRNYLNQSFTVEPVTWRGDAHRYKISPTQPISIDTMRDKLEWMFGDAASTRILEPEKKYDEKPSVMIETDSASTIALLDGLAKPGHTPT